MKALGLIIRLILLSLPLPACSDGRAGYQGYVEGEFLYLASSQAGRLEVLNVDAGREAASGATLFILDAAYEMALVRQAEGELASARDTLKDLKTSLRATEVAAIEAQVAQARAARDNSAVTLQRAEALFLAKSVSQARLDSDRAAAEADQARVDQLESQLATARLPLGRDEAIQAQAARVTSLEAGLDQARWRLGEKTVASPGAGLVYDVFYRPGEWVPAGGAVVRFLPPANVKVRFFVPEADFGRLKLGQPVLVEVDGVAEPVPARLTYLAAEAEYTPPVIYSNESRDKLVFMVEARADTPGRLNPGQPVIVRLTGPEPGEAGHGS